MRADGRAPDELRPVEIAPDFIASADGSCLVTVGDTRVICTASIGDEVPGWRRGSGLGWVTAEYGMLPGSTGQRRPREVTRGRPDGRTTEIQRLIGRSVRAVVDMTALGERTVWLDCDVIQADGGTRCAAVCGAWVALHRALDARVQAGDLEAMPLTDSVAGVSVGIVGGGPVLDLDYPEDSTADADMNVVGTGAGALVEVQASAEGAVFSRRELDRLLDLAGAGLARLGEIQRAAAAA